MHRSLEVTHRLLEVPGFVRQASEGEVGRQLGFAPLVVVDRAEKLLQRLLASGQILGEEARASDLQP